MDVISKIDQLMEERNWSEYRLAQESGLSSSTIANIHRRNTVPSVTTLEAICDAFGISLAQFFAEGDAPVHLNEAQQKFFSDWIALTSEQKLLVEALIKELKK